MSKNYFILFIFLFAFFFTFSPSEVIGNNQNDFFTEITDTIFSENDIEIEFKSIIVEGVGTKIFIILKNPEQKKYYNNRSINVFINDSLINVKIKNNKGAIPYTFISKETISVKTGNYFFSETITPIPLWLSILPPLIAILIALIFKEVFTALFIGILVGTTTIYFYQGSSIFAAIFKGMFAIIDTYILESLSDKGHLSIIVFSMLIGAMVNLITSNGGMKGIVNILSKFAKTARLGQLVTWFLGIIIFFDDYANTLVVGNTMRPITDKLKISREKLSYIVDSTAAPIAALALITTWIGIELSYIQDGINAIGINESAYGVFVSSLNTRFYPIFTLIFIFILVIKKRDFGPMLHAERKARKSENIQLINNNSNNLNESEISDKIKARWFNAAIPVLIVIFGTLAGLLYTGWDSDVWNNENISFSTKLSKIVGNSDSYKALLWSSLLGTVTAILLSVSQKLLSMRKSIDSLIKGFKTMLTAILILILAWSLALVTEHLHTADFISQGLVNANISPFLIPALTFILSALIAFSTGSSWGTMAILYPLILPASWLISDNYGMDYDASLSIFYNVVSSILAGSVLGDHCSPISDTTILSSLASSCNHIEHVRTQLPYALTVGAVSVVIGTIPAAYGISSYILFPLGIIVLYLIVVIFGKKVYCT